MSDDERDTDTDTDNQFIPQENDEETLWNVLEIVAEKGNKYRVRWEGTNPRTGKPWPLDWVPKSDCTPYLVKTWKEKQAAKKKAKKTKAPAAKARAKTNNTISASAKGKGKAKEVIPSDSESDTNPTRSTRSTAKGKAVAPAEKAGPSTQARESSPGIPVVRKIGPPKGAKRKRDPDPTNSSIKHPPSSDSEPVPIPSRKKKRRKINIASTSPQKGVVPTSLSHKQSTASITADSPVKPDPLLIQEPFPPPGVVSPEDDLFRGIDFDAPPQESRLVDVIPETQETFETSDIELPSPSLLYRKLKNPAPSHDSATRDDLHPEAGPSKRVSKKMVPARTLPMPDFGPHLPKGSGGEHPEDPIEESSPLKPRKSASRSVHSQRPDDQISVSGEIELSLPQISEMEQEYIDYGAGEQEESNRSPQRQPPRQTVSSQEEQSHIQWPEFSSLPFPATASTQRAVADSQSRVLAPDSQPMDTSMVLREKDELIVELREQLTRQEDEVHAFTQRCRDRDNEIAALRDEVRHLKSAQESLIPAELLDKQTEAYESALTNVEELKLEVSTLKSERTNMVTREELEKQVALTEAAHAKLTKPQDEADNLMTELETHDEHVVTIEHAKKEVAALQDALRANTLGGPWKAQSEERIRKLEEEVRKWRGLCELMRKQDERTNGDEIRRRAGEHPELEAKVVALQAERDELSAKVDGMTTQTDELQGKIKAQDDRISELEQLVLDAKANEDASDERRVEVETTNGSLLNRIASLEEHLRALRVQAKDSTRREGRLRVEKQSTDDELRRVNERVEALNAELSELRVGLKLFNTQSQTNVSLDVAEQWICIYHYPKDNHECRQVCDSREELWRHVSSVHHTP